jgi:23S rRNA pseudouridine955/2504/2580 synthase/23S rRNA pseudouridine1911/1915/1917 synthase
VVGRPSGTEGDIDAPLAPHPNDPKRMTVVKHGGRPARTGWKVEETFRGYALLRCFPKTGKTHQIRVHLKHIRLPLAVDPIYNRPRPGEEPGLKLSTFKRDYRANRGQVERPLIARLTLHAHRLTFVDPSGMSVSLEAPVPKDLRAALNQLRRAGGR